MSDTENTAPAGESEGEAAPDMTVAAAAARMADWSDEGEAPEPADQPAESDEAPTDEAEAPAGDEAEPEGDEAEVGEGEEPDTEQDDEPALDFDKIHGNTKLRLRDGRELTVGEIKKKWGTLEALESHQQELAHKESQFQQWANQRSQEYQQFQQLAPIALEALQARIPPEPEYPDWDPADLVSSIEAKDKYDRTVRERNQRIAEFQQLQEYQHQQAAVAQQQAQRQFQEYVQNETGELLRRMPELRDPGKAQEFYSHATKAAKDFYDFRPEEIQGLSDHRAFLVLKDAIAYRQLKANPPKPVQPKAATAGAPVAKPGRQMAAGEQRQAHRQELRQKAIKNGGSLRDIARLVEDL